MSDNKKMADFPKSEAKSEAKQETKVEAPPSTRDIVRDIMGEMLPAMAAAMQAAVHANAPRDPRAERAAVAAGPKCSACKQLAAACKGEHEEMVVYPTKYPEFGVWFRGVGINGVWYRSDNPGQLVTVPKCAADDIRQTVAAYEENERETRMGRVGGHDFGNVAAPRVAASNGWR